MTVSLSVLFFPRLLLCLIEDHVQVCFASKSRHLYPPAPLSLCIEEKFTSQSGDIGYCIYELGLCQNHVPAIENINITMITISLSWHLNTCLLLLLLTACH